MIVLPNAPLDVLLHGLSSEVMPPEYTGGLEGDGVRALASLSATVGGATAGGLGEDIRHELYRLWQGRFFLLRPERL